VVVESAVVEEVMSKGVYGDRREKKHNNNYAGAGGWFRFRYDLTGQSYGQERI